MPSHSTQPNVPFYVFCDLIVKRVRIHRSYCGACNYGKGMHRGKIKAGRGVTYFWEPAQTYSRARRIADRFDRMGWRKPDDRLNCGLCRPEL